MSLIKRIVQAVIRRIVRLLPRRARAVAKAVATRALYARNARGVAPDPAWRKWTAKNARPVSIVIPSYNDYALLVTCLESIARTAGHLDYEVIVVDDFADVENAARLKTLENDHVRVVTKPQREGFAKAVNRGMREVAGDRDIVLLNSDIVTLDGWLDALMGSAYSIDPKIGMVSGRLLYPNGTLQYGGTYYARVLAPQWFGHLYTGSRPSRPVTNVPWYNRSVSGACTYVTRECYDAVGGLNEDYWLGFEDVDWGLTAWEKGFRCYFQPAATCIHHESASRGYSQGSRELASMRLFWRRWEHLFLQREVSPDSDVDLFWSEESDLVWRRYLRVVAERLRAEGITVNEWQVAPHVIDEELVARLADRETIKVCCDHGAQLTTWFASLTAGKPVYLLSSVETLPFGHDPAKQARIVAGLRPEYDYIAPNRFTAQLVTVEAAWEVRHRAVPVVAAADEAAEADELVVVLGGTPREQLAVSQVARRRGTEVLRLADPHTSAEALDALTAARPKAVVSFVESHNSALPLLCMSRGAVYLGLRNDQTKFEVLDGFNAMTFAAGERDADGILTSARLLDDVLGEPLILAELRENGIRTVTRLFARSLEDLIAAFRHIARTPV